ncbi:MAG: M48 family metallopeptidase [Proteobacteria bacterium]|nr:M48 family metallopeptidase [Pseudomonadota bacterium]
MTRPAWIVALAVLVSACAAPIDNSPDVAPGQRPLPASVEADIWMLTDNAEKQIREAGNRVMDPAINAYVRRVVCTIAGPHCDDIRVYVIRVPDFNASMMPNGVMQVWTGLLLRAQNEAEFAYVIGHEIGHYLRRHTLKRMVDLRAKTDALVFVQLAIGAAGGSPLAGNLVQLLAMASLSAYSRDQERESDAVGFRLLVDAGYDPYQAAPIWRRLIAEAQAADEDQRSIFFASHPAPEERAETLERLAEESSAEGGAFEARYLEAILPLRAGLFRDELRGRRFDRLQVVLDHHFEAAAKLGELHYIQGELYRLRGGDGDEALAIEAYYRALDEDGAPPETHRDLGLVLMRNHRSIEARDSLRAYLDAAPEAEDRAMIRSYLGKLE